MKPLLAFDLDGTLIDSAQDIAGALNTTLSKHGKKNLDFDVIVAHIGDGLKKLISDFFPERMHDAASLLELELEFLEAYEKRMYDHTLVYPGVIDFLNQWEGPIGIITNKNEAPAKALVKHLGLNHFRWVEIFGADSLKEKKPSPLPLQTMMKLAQRTPQQTFMIGDGTPDMESARQAGTHSIAIGFGYSKKEILQRYQPTAHLNHYSQLFELINKIHPL